jgi:hypothetical protein
MFGSDYKKNGVELSQTRPYTYIAALLQVNPHEFAVKKAAN